jgi:catechol 2,3-dioxygenase-like lactoylglutathione lyase family enzyme
MTDTQPTTQINQIGTVIVPVSDQEKALDFYVSKLGMEKRLDVPFGDGNRWLEVAVPGSETSIAIVPPRPGDPAGGKETGIALTSKDVDADHTELRARGVDADPEVSRMGDDVPPMFWIRDQDQNTLLVVQRD